MFHLSKLCDTLFYIQSKYVLTINSLRIGKEYLNCSQLVCIHYSVFTFLFGYLSHGRGRDRKNCHIHNGREGKGTMNMKDQDDP
jgi:hypothetical protein